MRVAVAATLLVLRVLTLVAVAGTAEAKSAKPAKPPTDAVTDPLLQQLLLFPNADPDTGPAPLKVTFTAEIYEGDDAVKPKFEWDFGDGSAKSRELNPTHTYKKPGTYTAELTVKDAKGRKGQDKVAIEVGAPE